MRSLQYVRKSKKKINKKLDLFKICPKLFSEKPVVRKIIQYSKNFSTLKTKILFIYNTKHH